MGFVIGVLAALIVVFLLGYTTVKKPVFGGTLIAISLLMIVLAIIFYFQEDKRVENKKQRIPVEQIELSDIDYGFAYGNYYKLTAQIRNASTTYRLQAVILEISFLQCKEADDTPEKCLLLKKKLHKVETRLPAEQSGKIETYLLMDDVLAMQKNGSLRWLVKVASGMAR